MSKHMRKKKVPVIVPIAIVLAIVLIIAGVIFAFLFPRNGGEEEQQLPGRDSAQTGQNAEPESGEEHETVNDMEGDLEEENTQAPADPENSEGTKAPTSSKPSQSPGSSSESKSESKPESSKPSDPEKPESSGETSEEPAEPSQPTATEKPTDLPQRAEAEYEEWLAAAMIISVSMEYPDFELNGIYTPSATSLSEKSDSEGVYLEFTSGGETMIVHSAALSGERTESGTSDISTELLGFASFDVLQAGSVNTAEMNQIPLNDLEELINQSLLVSIHTR